METSTPQVDPPVVIPPLSILDLLLCMGSTAVGLTCFKLLDTVQPSWTSHKTMRVVGACLAAATVACLPRFVARWRRGERPVLPLPGHWLLATSALLTLLSWVSECAIFWRFHPVSNDLSANFFALVSSWWAAYCLILVLAAGLSGVAARCLTPDAWSGPWRFYFLVQAILSLFQAACALVFVGAYSDFSSFVTGGPTLRWLLPQVASLLRMSHLLDFLALSLVGLWDWRHRANADWLHRTGLVLLWSAALLSALESLLPLLV